MISGEYEDCWIPKDFNESLDSKLFQRDFKIVEFGMISGWRSLDSKWFQVDCKIAGVGTISVNFKVTGFKITSGEF